MLATLDGPAYIERVALDTPANVRKAKVAIKKAFETQVKGEGFSIIELLASCTTGWGTSPTDASKWITNNLIPYYPLGVYKDNRNLGGEK